MMGDAAQGTERGVMMDGEFIPTGDARSVMASDRREAEKWTRASARSSQAGLTVRRP